MRKGLLLTLVVGVGLVSSPCPAAAQEGKAPPASQHGSVSQRVNETLITVAYDRPVARGRTLFGDLVEWDYVWTPGANRATWINVTSSVTIQGVKLEAGRYGIWMVPHETEPWDVILVSEWDTHHSFFPAESEVTRVLATPERADHMEVLAFYFPTVEPYASELRLHWGETALSLRIEVPGGPEGS